MQKYMWAGFPDQLGVFCVISMLFLSLCRSGLEFSLYLGTRSTSALELPLYLGTRSTSALEFPLYLGTRSTNPLISIVYWY